MAYRDEKDALGKVRVPAERYFGAQTQRALENFPISGLRMPVALIRALALIKKSAAQTNRTLGLLHPDLTEAIVTAADETMRGKHDNEFGVDIFQTGSGTSTNMNMNEVLASRANELLGESRGGKEPVHPNDHVNLGQSSNDVIPTAIHVTAVTETSYRLDPALVELARSLDVKAKEFASVRKIGRTHLQDAVPMTLGDEFSGYAHQITLARQRITDARRRMLALALGGTAVGTGLNAHPEFATRTIAGISAQTGCEFSEAQNHFQAQATLGGAVELSGALRGLAVDLVKIANDIRWLASGPRCGLGEITLPALQPGSSIMPGKVNPVLPEAVLQVAAQVTGNDTAIALAGQGGNFELNTMLPVTAYNLLQSIEILANVTKLFAQRCVSGIAANAARCESFVEQSISLVTALVPHIGYDRAAAIAHRAYESGRTVREVVLAEKVLPPDELGQILK
jgi:fumarate hydratase class II